MAADHQQTGAEILLRALAEQGVEATQTTVSRDLEDLGAVKVRLPGGDTAYALPELPVHQIAPEDHLRRVLGEWVVESYHPGGRLWRAIYFGADASFGVFLFHMLPITLLAYSPLWYWLGFNVMPSILATLVMIMITLGITLPCVWALRRLPFSVWTTGRPRKSEGALSRVMAGQP